jgi:class 3 adenylate cyclase
MLPEEAARLHSQDLEIQREHGCNFITYWCDPARKCAFCLVDAPDAETAIKVHRLAHGAIPTKIIPVDLTSVMAFLGRIADPEQGGAEALVESAHRAVMFTDIVNSMDMTAKLGDARSTEMTRAHDGIVRQHLPIYRGREVKHTGDGIMAAFDQPANAVACACDCQRAVREFNRSSGELPLHLRIGIHAGAPVEDNKDLFGQTVQIAARICQDAAIDAVVITEAAREQLGDGVSTVTLGRRVLKGIAEPIAVFAVNWE